MATLENQQINNSYGFLVQIPDGITGSLTTLQSGDGTSLPLQLSTNTIKFTGNVDFSSSFVIGPISPAENTELVIRSGNGQDVIGLLNAGNLDFRPGAGGTSGFFNGTDGQIRFLNPTSGSVVSRIDSNGSIYGKEFIGYDSGNLFKLDSDGTDTEIIGYNGTVKLWAFDSNNASFTLDGINGSALDGSLTITLPASSSLPVLTIKEYDSQTQKTFRILTKDGDLRFSIPATTGTLEFFGSSSTTPGCNIVNISRQFSTSTHASRTGELTISPYYTSTAQNALIIRADSSGTPRVIAESLFIVRQPGGTVNRHELNISQSGVITTLRVAPDNTSGSKLELICRDRTYTFTDGTGIGFSCNTGADFTGNIRNNNAGYLGWSSTGATSSGSDTFIARNSSGGIIVTNTSTTAPQITIRGTTSQTGDLQTWQNSAPTTVAALSIAGGLTLSDKLTGFKSDIVTNATTSITIGTGTSGQILETTSASSISITLSASAPVGYCITIVQTAAGQITFAAGGSGTLRNRQSHTKTAGQWGVVSLYVRTNSGGSAAEWVLAGDTAA